MRGGGGERDGCEEGQVGRGMTRLISGQAVSGDEGHLRNHGQLLVGAALAEEEELGDGG